tara:strand:+ start:518 stop:1594 length:1077 start_codon:yes stop_codon:yes gene_type:complete
MSDFLNSLIKQVDDEYTTVVADRKSSAEFSGTIDTGSYALNALFSGSIFGGVSNNKITALAGESATGKTYFALGLVRRFLETHENGIVVYFDTESAVTADMMEQRQIDTARVIKSEPDTIQKFRNVAISMLDHFITQDEEENIPMMMVLDSLGQLSSTKEIEDSTSGVETRDMTKAQLLKATFRVLNLKMAKAGVPLIVCNHTYDVVGSYVPMKEMSGGSGLKYSASTIAFLTKKKERDGTEVVGNVIKVRMQKSRLSRENKDIEVLLTYDKGLDRYYGMIDFAIEASLFKKAGNRIELPDGSKQYAKTIYGDPEKYFTNDIMEKIEEYVAKEYTYGGMPEEIFLDEDRTDNSEKSDI